VAACPGVVDALPDLLAFTMGADVFSAFTVFRPSSFMRAS
jgi:hypothetical protein